MVLAHDLQKSQKTQDIQISQDVTFDTMLFSLNTLEGLKQSGFVKPSPIQLHGIPLGKCGFDLLLEAKSGTGKTAVFSVIALEKLDLDKGLQAVILAPTREIAAQICDVFRQIGCQYKGLRVEVVMGGLPVQEDVDKFKENKVHIVVGSPGRLKHLISKHHMDISAVRLLVFDEADKLMEKSFLADIKYIHLALPKEKQVIMSSATYPETCKEFIKEFVQDAQHICPNSDCVLLGVAQKVTHVKYNSNSITQTKNKFKEMLKIITTKEFKQCLIFCNYRARVREVYRMLIKEKWPAEQLYGAQDQVDRLDALKILQEYKCRILIATDLAARGIDASNVDLVINFEPPIEWQTYLHRIGRAGRFGSYGMAITILSEGAEQKQFTNLLSSVNFLINVSPLWTETESNNSNGAKPPKGQDHLHLNGTSDHRYSELWKIICDSENSPKKEVIEDFQDLVESFENTTNTRNDMESFADLCKSLQNNNITDTEECQYKCIKWPDLSTKQCLIGITNKVKDIVQEKNDSHRLDNHVNDIEERKCAKGNNQTNSIRRAKNNSIINNKDSNQICDNNSILNDKISLQTAKNSFASMTQETVKSRNLTPVTNVRNLKEVNQITPNTCAIKKINSSSSSSSSKDFQIRLETHTNRTLSSSSNENFKIPNSKPYPKCRTQPNVEEIQYKRSSVHPHRPTNPSSKKTHNQVHPTKEHLLSRNCYKHWYKELKIIVSQIELATYIDEISKL